MNLTRIRAEWFGNIRNDLLSGLVVALALIPEAIAFSIIAGVDPKVGLYASFCIAMTIAFVGGRPGMISAATGAMALVLVSLVREHGLEYMLAATLLTGVIQMLAGMFRLGGWIRFVSKSVVTGFVNALAILIFMAQLPHFVGAGWHMYAMVAAGLAIIYLLPRITKAIPSPLVTIVVVSLASIGLGLDLKTVGDMGTLPTSLPMFLFPDIPLTWETLRIILPYSLTLAAVGLLESLMTALIVDDMTDTPSAKNRECTGQGFANIVAGMFGGMAGCAMIGQSVINVKSGGRGRLSTFCSGLFLLILIIVLADYVKQIPMAALVAVMIMVSISTFNWASVRNLVSHPRQSSIVMLSTVAVVVATHDLARGVLVGVILSALFFAKKVSQLLSVESALTEDGTRRDYHIYGQVFFASAGEFVNLFDTKEGLTHVTINLTEAHFWDLSAVGALDRVVLKFRAAGTQVELLGLNEASSTIVSKLGTHHMPDAELPLH